jgi:hypothetical protein
MNNRERINAILNYKDYDKMPIVSFGYWEETTQKWAQEGHITLEEADDCGDNSPGDKSIMKKLGFDFNWNSCFESKVSLFPEFKEEILEEKSDGSIIMRDSLGLIVKVKPGTVSIPSEIDTLLTDRKAWEELYLPRLQFTKDRVNIKGAMVLKNDKRELPLALHCGSLMGTIRNLLGVEHLSYLYADDEDLYTEIIDTFGNISYECAKAVLETGAKFDYAHFWEDICFKNGPLVAPSVFEEKVGPHYKKITELVNSYGINIVSVDCDGCIDSLVPVWVKNGVNTMFLIEVGTWGASIAPWIEKYGKNVRGVGGMNKRVFSYDYKAVDEEIERLKRLIEFGGFIPCPDHRIPPDAIWENVQYYCEKLNAAFNK